jgi:TPP-dependent pyruvate/acetoin dehydrogenase alpha subunit
MRDAGYRTGEEIAAWKERDPIAALRDRLLTHALATDDDLDTLDAEIKALVADALAFATSSPFPDPVTATDHVYAKD